MPVFNNVPPNRFDLSRDHYPAYEFHEFPMWVKDKNGKSFIVQDATEYEEFMTGPLAPEPAETDNPPETTVPPAAKVGRPPKITTSVAEAPLSAAAEPSTDKDFLAARVSPLAHARSRTQI